MSTYQFSVTVLDHEHVFKDEEAALFVLEQELGTADMQGAYVRARSEHYNGWPLSARFADVAR